MKRLVLLILILFSVNVSFAQVKEQLSEKEKARREKNIQAGNPFKRFGYKPKIATLSKGKYLEFHDLDTIMRIGSFVFNTRQKKITGYVNLDTVHSEATLNPQLISRWLSPDPLSEEYPSWSPYNFTMNNPIRFIDPNGKEPMAPIYGTDGEFLGTDDEGLQGKAIVMDKNDFVQGMSHDDALNKNLGVDGLTSDAAKTKLVNHYNGLKDRPDYDGIVTWTEARKWKKEGHTEPLFVDFGKMNFNLSNLSVNDLSKDKFTQVNFFSPYNNHSDDKSYLYRPTADITLSYVYGTLRMKLVNANTGEVSFKKGFGIDPNSFDRFDFTNRLFNWLSGGGKAAFDFIGYGKAYINKEHVINHIFED